MLSTKNSFFHWLPPHEHVHPLDEVRGLLLRRDQVERERVDGAVHVTVVQGDLFFAPGERVSACVVAVQNLLVRQCQRVLFQEAAQNQLETRLAPLLALLFRRIDLIERPENREF